MDATTFFKTAFFNRKRRNGVPVALAMAAIALLALACGTPEATPGPSAVAPAVTASAIDPTAAPSASPTHAVDQTGIPAASPDSAERQAVTSAPTAVASAPAATLSAPAATLEATNGPATATPPGLEKIGPNGPARLVEPDPDYQNALDSARFNQGQWLTDFSLHTVPYDEFLSGGVPRDGIPPLDDPQFESIADADAWLESVQPVVALEINGEAKAYPLAILTWHEIANDTLGGVPVSVTFCPLCNSGGRPSPEGRR